MCGICGVWEYGASKGRVDTSLLTRMRNEMTASRTRTIPANLYSTIRVVDLVFGGYPLLIFPPPDISRCTVATNTRGWYSMAKSTITRSCARASNNAATSTAQKPTPKQYFICMRNAGSIWFMILKAIMELRSGTRDVNNSCLCATASASSRCISITRTDGSFLRPKSKRFCNIPLSPPTSTSSRSIIT